MTTVSLGVSVYVASAIFCVTCLPNQGQRENSLMAATEMQLPQIQEMPVPTDIWYTLQIASSLALHQTRNRVEGNLESVNKETRY